jgi:putative Mn2+ efflux pump MntP
MYAGKLVVKLFIPQTGNIFGAISLSFIGVYYIVEYIKIKNKTAGYDTSYYFHTSSKYKLFLESSFNIIELNNSKDITLYSCLKFSIEFLINNFLIIISAGITGINIDLCVLINFILSLLVLLLGYSNFNNKIKKFFCRYFYLIGGILLMVLGLLEIFI